MQRVPAEDFESLSVDGTADMDSSVIYPTEFLQTLTTAEMPTHRVVFKGRRAIHVATYDEPIDEVVQRHALCLLIDASPWVLHVEIATGPNTRQRAFVPRCKLTSSEGELPFVLTRRQFPVAPCFAMAVNKKSARTNASEGGHLPSPPGVFTRAAERRGIISYSWSWGAAQLRRTVRRESAPPGNTVFEEVINAQGDGEEGLCMRCPRIIEKRGAVGERGALPRCREDGSFLSTESAVWMPLIYPVQGRGSLLR